MNNSSSVARIAFSSPLQKWQTATLGGYDSAGAENGSGPVYHVLHGNGFCSRTLEPLAACVSPEGQWLFTDLPGHGISPTPQESEPDWNEMADLVARSLRERASGPVIGVGHSMGGVVTLLAAAAYPSLFQRIILLDPVLFTAEVLLGQRLLRRSGLWRRTALVKAVSARRRQWSGCESMVDGLRGKSLYRDWHPLALQRFSEFGTKESPEGISLACDPRWEAAIFGSYPRRLLSSIRRVSCRVDVVMATKSYPFIKRSVERAQRVNKNFRAHVFDGSHCFPMENPEATAQLINRILSER